VKAVTSGLYTSCRQGGAGRCWYCGRGVGTLSIKIWRDPETPLRQPKEENKARCFMGGAVVFGGSGKSGRRRKKPPKRGNFNEIYLSV
jgi:hypothetical protein